MPIALVNSVNPYRIEGQKTGAFEICDALGDAPDYLAIPVGNAGNITSYWKGFREYREAGRSRGLPKMIGFQAAGAAPLVLGHMVEKPETIATAIRIGNPARGDEALAAARDSGGFIDIVTDDEIIEAYKLVAASEGIMCEPASAASIAGLRKARADGRVPAGARVVCILTGHGLKDPDTAVRVASQPVFTDRADGRDREGPRRARGLMRKRVVLVPDGMADYPLAELGGRTPLEAAATPHMDAVALPARSGLVQTVPAGMSRRAATSPISPCSATIRPRSTPAARRSRRPASASSSAPTTSPTAATSSPSTTA